MNGEGDDQADYTILKSDVEFADATCIDLFAGAGGTALGFSNAGLNHILLNDLKEIVARALEQLTPRQREVFKMSRELQMSHKEIAEALGVSVHTVQEHISVSLKVIRSYLTKYSSTSADILLILFCLNL